MENVRFVSNEHKSFYFEMLSKARSQDTYHQAFFYAVGICGETRQNIHNLFDFREDVIMPEELTAGWQTGGTLRLCRLAFNLWNGWTEEGKEQYSAPYELFDCGFAPYFFEAIRLRYPEYCRNIGLSASRLAEKTR